MLTRLARDRLIGLLVMCVLAVMFAVALSPVAAASESSATQSCAAVEDALERLREGGGFGAMDAVVVLSGDTRCYAWGEVDKPMPVASVRKSILSLLYGIAVERGLVKLDAQLSELSIDESRTPLTPLERRATVRDLLMAKSGVYIEAAGETPRMRARRPRRGAYAPGEFFYYNNWDFNVLGVIFERRTGMSIGRATDEWLARPTGMTRFRTDDVGYQRSRFSDHPQYVMRMSTNDLARLGLLVLRRGGVSGRQVVPARWIDESTSPLTHMRHINRNLPVDAFGYCWWVDARSRDIWARGSGGQFLLIDHTNDLVIVTRHDIGRAAPRSWWRRGADVDIQRSVVIHEAAIEALQLSKRSNPGRSRRD